MIKVLRLFTANTKGSDEDLFAVTDLNDAMLDEKLGEKDAATLA